VLSLTEINIHQGVSEGYNLHKCWICTNESRRENSKVALLDWGRGNPEEGEGGDNVEKAPGGEQKEGWKGKNPVRVERNQ